MKVQGFIQCGYSGAPETAMTQRLNPEVTNLRFPKHSAAGRYGMVVLDHCIERTTGSCNLELFIYSLTVIFPAMRISDRAGWKEDGNHDINAMIICYKWRCLFYL